MKAELETTDEIRHCYDRLSEIYDETFQTPMALAENNVIFNLFQRYYVEEDRILDLGCGTGLTLEYLDIPIANYIGIDISEGMLERARKKFPHHHFLQGDMQDLTAIPSASQDLIISTFCSFSYAHQPRLALLEMRRVLKPYGMIFLLVASLRYPQRPAYIINQHEVSAPMKLMSAEQLKDLIEEAGFVHFQLSGFQWMTEHLSFLRSQKLLTALLKAEMHTIGRLFPETCYYHLLIAHRGLNI